MRRRRFGRRLGIRPTRSGSISTNALTDSWNVSGRSEIVFAFRILLPVAGTAIGIVRLCPQLDYWLCPAEASASGPSACLSFAAKERKRSGTLRFALG